MKDLGIGVIGLGMGRNMLYINEQPGFRSEVRAIIDTNEERLAKTKEEFGIPFAGTEYRDMLKRDDINLVGIFSPDHLHFEQIKDALEAGKHVICTKPMVISLEEAKEVAKLVRKHNRKFLVGQTRRFDKHNQEAKALYDSGKIGRPLLAEASYIHDMRPVFTRSPWRFQVPKDYLFGAACHPIDHLRWYFGDVEEVFAYGSPSTFDLRYPQDKEINFLLNLKFVSGLIARVMTAVGVCQQPGGHHSDIMPTQGTNIFGDRGTITTYHARYDEDGKSVEVHFSRDEDKQDFDGKEYRGHGYAVLKYIREMEDCILNNRKPAVNELDGAKCAAVSEAAWESIRTGRAVKVFNDFESP
ncbi:MAG: oxidoreductase [Paenibacillaceae bacterium]|nr:oxidoreductase [Paenibacillaceae bacterium]